jgi:hypothetical protein
MPTVAIGVAPNVGDFIYPTKTALAALTEHYFLTLQINLAEREDDRRVIARLFHAWSPISYVDAATAAAAIITRGAYLELMIRPVQATPGYLTFERSTPRIDCAAGFVYTWLQMPNLRAPATALGVLTEV